MKIYSLQHGVNNYRDNMLCNGCCGFAIMICEGAFPLMETDEMNFAILNNAYKSLAKNGKFIFTTLN